MPSIRNGWPIGARRRKLSIESLTVNGERIDPGQIRTLSSGRKNLEFQYTGLSFLEPSRITFRYLMEGFDKEWTNAGTRREAFYTNLPPGGFSIPGDCLWFRRRMQ